MVLNRMHFEYILFIMFLLGQHQRKYKERVIGELQENTEVLSITVTKKSHRLSQTLKRHKISLRKFP